jgi:S-adenosylmethionine hydrolase
VAAHLASGVQPADFGLSLALDRLTLLPTLAPTLTPGAIRGRVIACDRFGNLITNIAAGLLEAAGDRQSMQIQLGAHCITGVQQTYGAALPGRPLALINSAGLLEVAVRDGSAAQALGVSVGEHVLCQIR